MNKFYTLLSCVMFLFITTSYSQTISFCDDFESYNNGDPIAQTSKNWNTWGELMSGTVAPFTDDANVVNTVPASSGSNTLYLVDATGSGGPQDIVLMFDTTQNITTSNITTLATPYISGNFTYSHMMYVRPGMTGYFNFQAENIPGNVWALEVNLDANGDILMSNTNGTSFTASYQQGVWFEIKFEIDLSANNWEVFIDGVSQGSFANSINQLASLDLYPGVSSEYYVDDVCYSYTPATLDPINAQTYIINPIEGLAGQQRYPSVEVRNFGLNTINSFDISFDYNGNIITENITLINGGFGLASMQTTLIDFTNPIILTGGPINGTAYIYNINGGIPQSTSDDTLSISINAVTPANHKLVVGEEATGTWCSWCPRGAVALNWMDHDYEGYWQGIAVHNGDPMTNTDYDNAMAPYIGGYPSGLVDRGPEIDPSAFKGDFLQRVVMPPSAKIQVGADQNGGTLEVSLTVEALQTMSGTNAWSLVCVLVEDSVQGQGSQYYQANAYSGGNAGPLVDVDGSDWANKPSNVPDYLMIYRHVARAISPSWSGEYLDGTFFGPGDTETKCFTFNLDQSWDLSQIHIVGMLIQSSSGMIDNAGSSSITSAMDNGLDISCVGGPTEAVYLEGPENDKTQLYPNPANNKTSIVNLPINTKKIKVIDIKGSIVLEVEKTETINISELPKGIYEVQIITNKQTINRKLIKK